MIDARTIAQEQLALYAGVDELTQDYGTRCVEAGARAALREALESDACGPAMEEWIDYTLAALEGE